MSKLSYFYNVWKNPGPYIDFNCFFENWTELLSEAETVEAASLLLFDAARLVSGRSDHSGKFSAIEEKSRTRNYFVQQLKDWMPILKERKLNFSPKAITRTLKAYNILQVIPPKDIQRLLIAKSIPLMGEFNAKDLRYLMRNFAGLNVYPGDIWIKAWRSSMEAYEEDSITEVDLLDTLYYISVMDFIRSGLVDSREESPCRHLALGMLKIFQDDIWRGQIADPAIYYSAQSYKLPFIDGAHLKGDEGGQFDRQGLFYNSLSKSGCTINTRPLNGVGGVLTRFFMLQNETPPVICKLDGPSIIIQDTKRGVFLYNPSIRLVSGVQSRDNPDAIVVMVPDKLLRHFFNMDITEIISMLLEKLDNTSPGHYVLHPDGLRSVEEKGAWEFEIPQGAQLSCSL